MLGLARNICTLTPTGWFTHRDTMENLQSAVTAVGQLIKQRQDPGIDNKQLEKFVKEKAEQFSAEFPSFAHTFETMKTRMKKLEASNPMGQYKYDEYQVLMAAAIYSCDQKFVCAEIEPGQGKTFVGYTLMLHLTEEAKDKKVLYTTLNDILKQQVGDQLGDYINTQMVVSCTT